MTREVQQVHGLIGQPRQPLSLVPPAARAAHAADYVPRSEVDALQAQVAALERRLRDAPAEATAVQLQDALARSKDLYVKYTRAESFRKALVYQKRYLVLLLGGFHEAEDATLAMIAAMGATPAYAMGPGAARARGKWRRAFLCIVTVTRLRILQRRWAVRGLSR